jgi:hypothetical protein
MLVVNVTKTQPAMLGMASLSALQRGVTQLAVWGESKKLQYQLLLLTTLEKAFHFKKIHRLNSSMML